ncbi:MAG: flavin reductase family protein, partial [Thermodesulfobacteriota bacterium]|nr:flavin reductase family protein [Thermodesulfobacteriota bacterium]
MELKPEMFKNFLPLPITLITTVDQKGIPNAAPYSCVMPILRPLDLIAIASALPHDTLKNIRHTKEFVVNVMGNPSFRETIKCAREYPPEKNELVEVDIETTSSKKVSPPRVKDAIGWIETRMEKEITGDNYSLIIGKVLFSEI